MRRGALALVAALLLSGCSAPANEQPDGLSVSVFQTRFDYAERALEIRVTNETDATLTVTSATFESTRFVATSSWDRPQKVPAGSARDLRVFLAAPNCSPSTLLDEVVVDYVLADGTTGSARIPIDDVSTIDAINEEDCLLESVAAVASIVAADELSWEPRTTRPAILDLLVSATGSDGVVEIQAALGTVLLGLVDEGGTGISEQPENLTIDADSPDTVVSLRLVPNRCDPHAVAEDRRGTFFPLLVTTSDGRQGRIVIPVSDEVRADLYDFFADYCGLP